MKASARTRSEASVPIAAVSVALLILARQLLAGEPQEQGDVLGRAPPPVLTPELGRPRMHQPAQKAQRSSAETSIPTRSAYVAAHSAYTAPLATDSTPGAPFGLWRSLSHRVGSGPGSNARALPSRNFPASCPKTEQKLDPNPIAAQALNA
jgi:hypothetical protein